MRAERQGRQPLWTGSTTLCTYVASSGNTQPTSRSCPRWAVCIGMYVCAVKRLIGPGDSVAWFNCDCQWQCPNIGQLLMPTEAYVATQASSTSVKMPLAAWHAQMWWVPATLTEDCVPSVLQDYCRLLCARDRNSCRAEASRTKRASQVLRRPRRAAHSRRQLGGVRPHAAAGLPQIHAPSKPSLFMPYRAAPRAAVIQALPPASCPRPPAAALWPQRLYTKR